MGFKEVSRSYYVSNAGTGTGLTSGDPMSTADFITAVPNLIEGSTVYFNKGETFEIGLALSRSNITFDAYGSGANPVIIGSTDISSQSWTLDSGSIYYTTVVNTPKAVFVNGVEAKKACTVFINVASRASSTTVTANAATLNAYNSVESLVGAEFVAKALYWRPSKNHVVTGYNSGTGVLSFADKVGTIINVSNSGGESLYPNNGMGFRLRNNKSFISDVNDWSYDESTDRLYIKTSGSAPTGSSGIRVCTENYGIDISETIRNITIRNITFANQYLEGVRMMQNKGITIENCTFRDIHLNGVSARKDCDDITIQSNTFYNICGSAINIGAVNNSLITLNTIYDIGIQNFLIGEEYAYSFRDAYIAALEVDQWLTLGVSIGIHLNWDKESREGIPNTVEISYNNLSSIGYLGIGFVGKNITVHKNIVSDYCRTWNDGGGIYCISRPFADKYNTRDCTISYNIVKDGLGTLRSLEGTTLSTIEAEGIYIDNGCVDITVDHNVVDNISQFPLVASWDTSGIIITNNIVVGQTGTTSYPCILFRSNPGWTGYQGIKVRYGESSNYTFTGNIMAVKNTTAPCAEVYSGSGNTSFNPFSSGNSDNNIFINPYGTMIGKQSTGSVSYTLAGWRTKYGDDAGSSEQTNYITYSNATNAAEEVKLYINETDSPVNFTPPAGYKDVTGASFTGAVSVPAYYALVYLKETAYP